MENELRLVKRTEDNTDAAKIYGNYKLLLRTIL